MFVLCPHCQFLVGLEPGSELPPERCPRCRQPLQPSPAPDLASMAGEPLPPTPALEPEVPHAGPLADAPIVQAVQLAAEALPQDTAEADGSGTSVASGLADESLAVSHDGQSTEGDIAASAIPGDDRTPVAAAATPAARRARWRAWRPPAAAGRGFLLVSLPLLLILLALQSLLSDRAHLAADARWRPLIAAVCGALRCDVPPWREPEAFTMLHRDVRPDPHRPGVLHVTATFRNDARWPQPLPSLLLTLSDADGRIAGERLFTPADYLGGRAQAPAALASGQSIRATLDVVEPPQGVVAFTFDLR